MMYFYRILKIKFLNYRLNKNKKRYEKALTSFKENANLLEEEMLRLNKGLGQISFTLQKILEKNKNQQNKGKYEYS